MKDRGSMRARFSRAFSCGLPKKARALCNVLSKAIKRNGLVAFGLRLTIMLLAAHAALGFTTLCPGTHACQSKPLARAHAGPRKAAALSESAGVLERVPEAKQATGPALSSLLGPHWAAEAIIRARQSARRRTLGTRLLAATLKWAVDRAGDNAILAFTSPGAFRTLYDWRKSCYGAPGQLRTALEDAAFELEQHVAFTTDLSVRVEHRAKGLLSTFSKAGRGKKPRDILAVRLLIPGHDEKSCYAAMRAVHGLWRSTGHDYKDYVASPKQNGYQSLHDTVLLPCGRLMEVQVRTASMHRHAERGAASHSRYKGSGSIDRLAGAIGGLSLA